MYNKLCQLDKLDCHTVACRLLTALLLAVSAAQQTQQAAGCSTVSLGRRAAQALKKAVVVSGASQTFLPLLALRNCRRASSTDLPMSSKEEGRLSCMEPLLSMLSLRCSSSKCRRSRAASGENPQDTADVALPDPKVLCCCYWCCCSRFSLLLRASLCAKQTRTSCPCWSPGCRG